MDETINRQDLGRLSRRAPRRNSARNINSRIKAVAEEGFCLASGVICIGNEKDDTQGVLFSKEASKMS